MGVAGSKVSEIDAFHQQTAARRAATTSHIPSGTKRRQTDQTAFRSPKRRKAARLPDVSVDVDLAFRSPGPGLAISSGRVEGDNGTSAESALVSDTGLPVNFSATKNHLSPDEQSFVDDARRATPEAEANVSQAMIPSPQFRRTLQSLRQGSEEVPSGWTVAATAPISDSQLQHNLTMVRKAIASLQGVHLTPTYSKDHLQLSDTTLAVKEANSLRALRRRSVQPSGLPPILRRSGVERRVVTSSMEAVATKRPHVEEDAEPPRNRKYVRKALDNNMRSRLVKRRARRLTGLWRKDDWAGWSGLLRREL